MIRRAIARFPVRLLFVAAAAVIAAGLSIPGAPAAAEGSPVPSCSDSLCLRIPWGAGPGSLARGDTTQSNPGPLFEVRDGVIILLDRIDGRLLFCSPGGATRSDTLPSFEGIPFSQFTDLRVAFGRAFLLALVDRQPFVFTWDPQERRREAIPLHLDGEMTPPQADAAEPYKLVVGPGGVHLFQRLAQWSLLIHDGRPVPPEKQQAEEGLVVGAERVRFDMPKGSIRTVGGRALASGALRASGGGCLLVAVRADNRETLEMHDLARGTMARSALPSRGRGPLLNTGTRYRVEGGYYELYFDRAGANVVRWRCPGW
jgi:hypothetical protein